MPSLEETHSFSRKSTQTCYALLVTQPAPIRVGLVLGREASCKIRLQHGIQSFAAQRARWIFRSETTPDPLLDWGCQGIVAMVGEPELFAPAVQARCPVVNVSNRVAHTGLSTLHTDDVAVGRVAAAHLLSLGLDHFAFAGNENCHFARQRQRGYTAALAEKGHTPHVLDRSDIRDKRQLRERDAMLVRWLNRLPRPVAVLCAEDAFAEWLLNICLEQGIAVPDEVAVLGVNDHTIMCESLSPPLSSVSLPFERIGYEAARLLHTLMQGGPAPTQPILLPPGSVTARRSTRFIPPDNPLLARAIELMLKHHAEELNIADIAEHMKLTRRQLEHLFARSLQTTPARHLEHIRLDHVKKLLVETDLPMADIAAATGYTTQTRMGVAFRRTHGITPTAYRRQIRLHGD